MRRRIGARWVMVAAVIALGGCLGGDDEDPTTEGDTSVATTTAPDSSVTTTNDDDTQVATTSEGDTSVATTAPTDTSTTPDTIQTTSYSTFIGDFELAPRQETTKCVLKRLSNTEPIYVKAIRTTLNKGSHHLIVYRSSATEERTQPFSCTPFVGSLSGQDGPLMISQIAEEELAFPPGVVLELAAGQMIRIEAHYINLDPDEPITAHADVEFVTTDTFEQKANFLFYGTTDVALPPNQETVGDWKYTDAPNGINVFAMTGHVHQYGDLVEIEKASSSATPGAHAYPNGEDFSWDEAPVVTYDPPLAFGPGEGFRFRCTWFNDSDSFVGFGESANAEMCFFWAYYYPDKGYRVCAEGLFPCQSDG